MDGPCFSTKSAISRNRPVFVGCHVRYFLILRKERLIRSRPYLCARIATTTSFAPTWSNIRAASLAVLPVVMTSSTSRIRFPLRFAPRRTRKARGHSRVGPTLTVVAVGAYGESFAGTSSSMAHPIRLPILPRVPMTGCARGPIRRRQWSGQGQPGRSWLRGAGRATLRGSLDPSFAREHRPYLLSSSGSRREAAPRTLPADKPTERRMTGFDKRYILRQYSSAAQL